MKRNFFWNRSSSVSVGKRSRRMEKEKMTKKKKIQTWTHTFVCLSQKDQDIVPDVEERTMLQLAGLGERKVSFNVDADNWEIREELQYNFPKLRDSGGFELLRLSEGGGKILQSIACPKNGYCVPYLRAVVHHAKVYLRPLQKDLDVDDTEDDPSSDVSNFMCASILI